MNYDVLVTTKDSTVVAEYKPIEQNAVTYQSEEALEKEFIKNLQLGGYEYLAIKEEKDLILNLRKKIEELNHINFSDKEWESFFKEHISNPKYGIVEKTKIIQEDYIKTIKRENGSFANIYLIDKKNIHNNKLQVINQYEVNNTERQNRYDVTILVNGFPLLHIELKRRGVSIKEAFNQINRYQRESFWSNSGLFEFVQIFVISNGTYTKYYSNTTRNSAVLSQTNNNPKKVSKSYEFTNYWSDQNNKPIYDLVDFTKTFFSKHTLLNILTKYCVFTTEENLLVLRPYQICAVEKILNVIEISSNYKTYGTKKAGGYLFHTTGSGKTLTSFVTAKRACTLSGIEKILFVVDRKDLDSQTIGEYEKYQKGAVNGNTDTKQLQEQLEDNNKKIIVTTIQKLGIFVKKNKNHPIYNKHIVIIFDECHRSQFGELHQLIEKSFKKYHMFGFTGTPIYAKNAGKGSLDSMTTEQVFGEKLHSYTIIDAIRDNNVLPFSIDYVDTFKISENIKDSLVENIDTKAIFLHEERIKNNVTYILDHYNQKTKRKEHYTTDGKIMSGFNSLLACDSIEMAIKYYNEFKKQIKERQLKDASYKMKIATIFSFSPNSEEEEFDTSHMTQSNRDSLESAIMDYNAMFGTNYDTSSKEFYNYYLDLTKKIKNNEIDITIVVNMLLTGFDSPVTNTLWIDKKVEMHGLIQSFSRTNRILNSIKSYGKIVCFRDLREKVDEALALYGDKDASGIVVLHSYDDYLNGFDEDGKHCFGYEELIQMMKEKFGLPISFSGENEEKEFIRLFGLLLKSRNILTSFDDFEEIDEKILSARDLQNYQSVYLDCKEKYTKTENGKKENVVDDIEFETELVEQVSINIDYILHLIEKYHSSNCEDKDLLNQMRTAINSSTELRSKKELIEKFCNEVNIGTSVGNEWTEFVKQEKKKDLDKIIEEENLKGNPEKFMNNCFERGEVITTGQEIISILPNRSFFDPDFLKTKQQVINRLKEYFDKFKNL